MGVAKQHIQQRLYVRAPIEQTEAEEMEAQAINVLITGANRGLGLEMVKQMVECQIPVKKLIASCRDPDGPRAEVSLNLLCFSLSSLTNFFYFYSANYQHEKKKKRSCKPQSCSE